MDGWLYPTYPPLTKGRKQTPLLSGCSLLLAVLSFVNELLNIYNSERSEESSAFLFCPSIRENPPETKLWIPPRSS